MLKGNILLFQRLKQPAAKADFRVHHRLFHVDDSEILVARDARDGVFAFVILRLVADDRARLFGMVRVADIGRNARNAHREDRVLMQHARAHIGKFAQLAIGDIANRFRIAHNARIGHQTAGNVRPVFIHVGLNRARNNRARDIAAAAGKGFDVAVRIASVKARHNRALMPGQQRAELFLCLIAVQPPLFVKENPSRDNLPAECR